MVLQTIREKITGIMAFFILGIIAIPFAFVGVNSYFQASIINLVALVNDQEITFNDFNQSFLNYRRRMQSLMGNRFDPMQFDGPVARREHLDNMIDEALLAQAVNNIGFDVDNERLAERIRNISSFQVDGVFNADVYASRLQTQGLSPQQFEREMRAQIVLNQLPQGIAASSFGTQTELEEFIALQEQTRSFRIIVIPAVADEITEEFSDEDVGAWYKEHQADFQSEERVTIEYIELDAATFTGGEEPDEEFLRNRFEQQKGRFITPEQRQVSHILIELTPGADDVSRETARQQAQDLTDRARAGEDFAALASEHSDDLGSSQLGGDLGWVEPGFMVEAFEDAMYELTLENPVSDPVQTGFGWHVIKLRAIEESTGMNFEQARSILVTEYQEEEAEREFLDLADKLVDIVYEDPTTLEAASLDLGIEIKQEGPFSRSGGEGIGANPEVVRTAFSDLVLLQGSVSDPVDLGTNHLLMLRVSEHRPAAIRPLEDVREEIIGQLRQQRASAAARAQADEMLASLDSSEADLDSLSEQSGLEIQLAENAKRRNFVPDPQIVAGVFKLEAPLEGEPLNAVVEAPDGFAVVVLESVTDGSLDEGAVLAEQQFRRQVANANASYEAWALLRQLRELSDVQVFDENLGVSR